MSGSFSRCSSSFSLISDVVGGEGQDPPLDQGAQAVLAWVDNTGRVGQALRACLEQLSAKQRPLAHKRVCADVLASMLMHKHLALLDADVRDLVQHLLQMPRSQNTGTQLCLLLLLCSLHRGQATKELVFGSAASTSTVLGLCTGLMASHHLSTASEAAACLLHPILPLLSNPAQAKQAAAAVVQLLQHCAEAAWMEEGDHGLSEAAQDTCTPPQLSSKAAHTACVALQALLSKFPAEAAGEVMAGKGVGALVKLMDASSTAAAAAAAAVAAAASISNADADHSLQTMDLCAACLHAVVSMEEEAANQIVLSGGCRVLLALLSGVPAVSSSTSAKAVHMLARLQQHESGRDELVALGGLPQLSERAAAEPALVVRALHCFSSSSQPAHVSALCQCQPALTVLVLLLGSSDEDLSVQALQALLSLVHRQPAAPADPAAVPGLSAVDATQYSTQQLPHSTACSTSCSPELAARLQEAGIVQQLEALTLRIRDEQLSQVFSVAAAVVASSEACAQQLLLQQKAPEEPLGSALAVALHLCYQLPQAAQLLLHVLQHCSNQGAGHAQASSTSARLKELARGLFAKLPGTDDDSLDASLLQATATAWSMLSLDVCGGLIASCPSSPWKLAVLARRSAHDPAAFCILNKAISRQNSSQFKAATMLEAISQSLEHALLSLPALSSNSSISSSVSSSSSRGLLAFCAETVHIATETPPAWDSAQVLRVLSLCSTLLHTSAALQCQHPHEDLLGAGTVERVCSSVQQLMGDLPVGKGSSIHAMRRLNESLMAVAAALKQSQAPANTDAWFSTVQTVSMIAGAYAQGYKIFVKTLAGNTITLEVGPSDTISNVMSMIQDKEGIPYHTQSLYLAGKLLHSSSMLARYDICRKMDGVLNLILKY